MSGAAEIPADYTGVPDEEVLRDYRSIYTDETGERGPMRDVFAAFMLERFGAPRGPDAHGAREWARRFVDGIHLWKMGGESEAIYVDVLTGYRGDLGGTAPPLSDASRTKPRDSHLFSPATGRCELCGRSEDDVVQSGEACNADGRGVEA